MHRGHTDDRAARLHARDHASSPRYANPGAGRARTKRRCARAARRALRQEVDDISTAAIERDLDDEAAREERLAEIRKACDESILWDDYEWDYEQPYYYHAADDDYDPGEDRLWADLEWDCAWAYVYDYSTDYDEEIRLAVEDSRERARGTALYLQGEDPECDDREAATSREFERRARRRRFHQKYHRD